MEKYYKEFCFIMDNLEWHYAKYSYSRHKKMEELFDIKNDIEKYYKFHLLTYNEYFYLGTKLQDIVDKEFIYK